MALDSAEMQVRPNPAPAGRVALSTIFPTTGESRLALTVVVVSVAIFLAAAPFAQTRLASVPAFIPVYETALIVNDLLTALLLFGQFAQARSRALLVLALGYLFDALIIIPHALTFPGLFAPTGLLGAGPQSTAWLYMLWHGGFPIFVIAYAMLQRRDAAGNLAPGLGRSGPSNSGVIVAILAITLLVIGLTALATSGQDALPNIMEGSGYTPVMKFVVTATWGVSALALFVLWRNPRPTALDLWLMVVMAAWLFDIALSAVLNAGRFDLGFYAGRIYGLLAASFVLIVLLLETSGLYSRVARDRSRLEEETQRLEADVQEQKAAKARTEAQLWQAQKMEAIGNLTGGMAHDFNNLLAIIIGNLDLLGERKTVDKEDGEMIKAALDAAMRGADLNRRLLAFARRQPLQPQRVNLNDLIGETVKLLSRMLGQHIEITTDLGPDLWPVVVDPAQLSSSLTNLATNARDAMPNGGTLTIVSGNRQLDADYAAHADVTAGDYAMIEISDSGTGMPPEVLARIFEPFFTTKETGKGTGLGLSMVFGFIKQSGGHINVYSEPGVGTTFRLYLPRAQAAAAAETVAVVPQLARGRGERVLVVEDNVALKRVVVRQLNELGYSVLEALNAAGAIAVLERESADLMFTDVIMPGGTNGFELARIVAKRWPELRVVFTSGFPETRLSGNVESLATARLLTKPYRKEDLARMLREALDAPVTTPPAPLPEAKSA
jgi:signal transduction histidine kinase/ActR/RegA family two-component response regulator